MKFYPSIPRGYFRRFQAHTFDKVDGSLTRWEWSKKRGWYKYGTRTRLFDETDLIFGSAIALFHDTLAAPIADIAKVQQWDRVVAFAEFHGLHSLAGTHLPEDPKSLTLFDISPLGKGILPPTEFLKLFGHLEIPRFLGIIDWDHDYVDQVRQSKVEGITFEGVVGKAEIDKKIIMEKAKTQAWIDKVLDRYGDKGKAIVES